MKRHILSVTVIILSIGILLSGCASISGDDSSTIKNKEDYTIKIGYGTGLCHAPIHIAIENGYFAEEGLKFEAVKVETAVIADAISSNQIDAGFGLVGKFIQPIENGLPIKLTSGIHTGCIKIVVPKDSSISSIADLKGKKIGVAGLADSPALIAKRALAAEGIGVTADNLEVEFIEYSNTDLPIALNNGAIDAIAGGDPVVSLAAEEYSFNVLLDTAESEQYKDEYCCVSFVDTELAEKYPELAAKYTRAVMKASTWIEEHPLETAQIQIDKNYVSGNVEFNASLLDHYNFKPSVDGGYSALENAAKELQNIGVLKADTNIQDLMKNSYVFLSGVENKTK